MRFVCQFCTDYSCLKCNKHVYYRQKGVLCTGCNLWIHQKCANLANNEYKEFQNEVNEVWYCRNCKADMLPFFNLTNNQFLNFLNINIYVSNHQVDENRFTNPINSLPCSVCYKKNQKANSLKYNTYNSLKYNTYKSLIHKKYTNLKTNDILYIKTSKKKPWECLPCQALKFPFSALNDHDILKETFNSNFSCKCHK